MDNKTIYSTIKQLITELEEKDITLFSGMDVFERYLKLFNESHTARRVSAEEVIEFIEKEFVLLESWVEDRKTYWTAEAKRYTLIGEGKTAVDAVLDLKNKINHETTNPN